MRINVAIAQFSPAVLDLKGSVEKACRIIDSAGRKKVKVLAFPETWIPVYPLWSDMGSYSQWGNEAAKKLYRRLHENSISMNSPELRRIGAACRKAKLHLVLGANERSGKSIYNSLFFFNGKGQLIGHHRKLVPTFGERLVWGHGDASGLRTYDTPFGRLGGLICWEHWMPIPRHILHTEGEIIHVASWPHGKEMHQIASRHYAFEGRCFVLAAGMYLEKRMFPRDYELASELKDLPDVLIPGGSSIIGPDGAYIVEPLFEKEQLIVAEIETERAVEESLTLDVGGHYSRPDLFEVSIRRSRRSTA